jgi:hypothetical protein
MKNILCIMMLVLASLCFFFIGPSAANAQDRDTGKQKKMTNRSTGKAERPKAEKPPQAVETPGKRGKKVVIPGKDLS